MLTQCPDCSRPVSIQAPTCPGCGRPIAAQAERILERDRIRAQERARDQVLAASAERMLVRMNEPRVPAFVKVGLVILAGAVAVVAINQVGKSETMAALASTVGILGVVTLGYFFPTVISVLRKHRNCAPIAIVNLLLGWTVLGWVVAFAWSLSSNTEQR